MNITNLENDPKIKSGFKVPENYFEDFPIQLFNSLPQQEPKTISIYQKRKKWLYAAAAILLLIISITAINNLNKNENEQIQLENYLVNNININDNDLAELLTQNDIDKMQLNLNLEKSALENELIITENLEEYIID